MAALVINEVDYDQPGADDAEFIELYNAGPGSVNLNGYRVELINGTGGGAISYNFFTLPGVILAADDYYVICANAATVANCDLDETPDTNLIQNGAPDAIGLRDPGNVLIDALSYEGDTGAPYTEGSGVGLEDIGVAGGNEDMGLSRLPNGVDTDMNNVDFTYLAITPGTANMAPPSSNLVINEIDYDQPGGDAAEFVEIYNPGPGAVDLTGHTVVFINGSGGGAAVYDTIALTPIMLAADDYFVICANAATVANCDLDDGPDTNFLQNGAPDAVGLRDAGATLLDSVSYEGDVPGFVEGSGAGLADDNATANFGISRLPNGTDTNMNNVDLTFTDITPGAANGAMNTPPVAQDDNVMTDEDTLLMGDVLADNGNGADSDADMDMLMVTEVNGSMANIGMQVMLGSGALLTLNANGTFDYDPNGQFEMLMAGGSAMDSFMYTLSDGTDTDMATVTVTINGVDDAPTAVADSATVLEDAAATTINVLMNDMDIDGGPLTVASTTQPAGGMVTIAGDMLSVDYTPNGDACNDGVPTDDFDYTVNGGSMATVAVTVTCVNDAPSFTAGPNQLVADNAGAQTVNGWATAISAGPADEAGQSLTYNITGNTNPAILAAGPAVDAMGNLSYTPAMGADGTTTITLELMDNGGTVNGGVDTSASQMFDITVTATSADLQLDISNNALPPLMPGATFDYTLDLTNNGPGTATNSSVLINLPNQLTVTGMPACIINNGNGTLTWNAGDLAPAAMAQCVFSVQVNLPGTIRLMATATSDLADPVAGNSTDVTSTLFSQAFAVPSMNTVGLIMLALILMMAGMRQQHRMRS